jgi:hypothetical protein
MKEAIKMTWILIVLAFIAGASGGAYFMSAKDQKALTSCENAVGVLQSQVDQFCEGTRLMDARVTTVRCTGKDEICVCGDPNMLNGGM